jgi:hypothetical protein
VTCSRRHRGCGYHRLASSRLVSSRLVSSRLVSSRLVSSRPVSGSLSSCRILRVG